ncbi:hypothetical protein [Streptomyces buecherae]|uniref:hypothetical protein n=1 Tax=Streptomyces buecherae TaxID=2763006 RepID=UPI00164CECD6|nr:hypothetical protein [Streptomyces buecherae]QNJ42017.1 hypothetical protein H7H31_21285 [Streptomyces buecherae]
MSNILRFISQHGVRLYALLAAAIPLLLIYIPGLPAEALLSFAATLFGAGEVAQRHEDRKTDKAMYLNIF